mmetsp:Transcript_33745/g.77864  ORF Transcript_33745/g.77864 Transcript_33745/m.77864 type:complete len:99 (-) Transcript_33745:363-659(-)
MRFFLLAKKQKLGGTMGSFTGASFAKKISKLDDPESCVLFSERENGLPRFKTLQKKSSRERASKVFVRIQKQPSFAPPRPKRETGGTRRKEKALTPLR